MISVHSSDVRIDLGLGFTGLEEEIMEDNNFEEESTVSCVDPDSALSYIDEKLENVLGHFQKDFEGGVSAENLGAKFGGYGSFLSMYKRSPSCLRPKSPPEVQNQVLKLKKFVNSSNIGTPDSKQKMVTKTSSSAPSNHKALRLRIKVGTSDHSELKNVSSCSTQGLNMLPSTLRENCLSEAEERLPYGIHDSPTKIIMDMVSIPLHKDQLLSPLSDDLIQLGKKEKIMKDAGYGSVNKSDSKNTHDVLDVSDAQECADKVPIRKKEKLKDRLKYMVPPGRLDGNHIVCDTENEADKQSWEEVVSKTPKLPLLSCLSPSYIHPTKETDKVSDSYVEGTLRGTNNTHLDAALMGSKPELEDNVEESNHLHSKYLSKSSDLNEDRDKTKQSVRSEGENKHSLEGGVEKLEMEPEMEIFGTYKKQKTGKSQFSAVDQHGSNKILDGVASNNPISHGRHDDRKRELKENKESGGCMRRRETAVMESSEEEVRKKKRLNGSSCERKELRFRSESCDRDRGVSQEKARDSASHLPFTASSSSLCKDLNSEIIKTSVHKAKGSLVESVAPLALRVLDSRKLISGRISEKDEHHDANSNAGGTLKRCRDGEGCGTIDKPGTTEKAAKISEDDNLVTTGQAIHSWDKERAYGENGLSEKHKPKKSRRYSGENCREGESQRKNKEEGSSAPVKDNNLETVNKVQDLGTTVEVKAKESRSKKRPARKMSMESNKEDLREYQDFDKLDINGSQFSSPQKSDRAKTFRGKSNHLEVTAEKLKNMSAPSADTDQVEVLAHGREVSNTKKQILRNDNLSVTHDVSSRNLKQNGSSYKDHVLSPLKKESTSQAVSNSIKEATDLKHMGDRLKNAGLNHESTGLYFQAALKFLHGASLLESSSTEHATHNSIARSRHIYGSTAKLCEFCAHEYEKIKDAGAAALAYKCMEVAYLRIIYSSHSNISRYRHELQAALQVTPSDESPSFASDGENTNQTLAAEKLTLSSSMRSSPRVTGNHVLSSVNSSSLSQLLAFSQNTSFGMDASRKAQTAFAAAKGKAFETRYSSDGITSIKRALDFNFQDMEKLVRLVRLAMESITQ